MKGTLLLKNSKETVAMRVPGLDACLMRVFSRVFSSSAICVGTLLLRPLMAVS